MQLDIVGESHFTADGAGNNLLRALRPFDASLLQPHLHEWSADAGKVLYEPGDSVQWVYFPTGPSMISYLVVLEDGLAIETALIGREGAVGGIVSQGRLPAYSRAIVQFPGSFLRIESSALEEAKMQSLSLRHLFARYADCVMAQIFQSVACNAAHSIEQRTAKWLLSAIVRTGGHEIPLTQEQLASMLGVGRSYISRIIQSLKNRGLIETKRGALCIRDLDALARLGCGCNRAVREHFEDVLAGVYPVEGEETAQPDAAVAA